MASRNRITTLRQQAFRHQGGHCYYCGVRMWLRSPTELPSPGTGLRALAQLQCTAEHLTAQRDGGGNTVGNIAAACARCNRGRHKLSKPPEPSAFRNHVARRVARRRWHHQWVYEVGLLSPGIRT